MKIKLIRDAQGKIGSGHVSLIAWSKNEEDYVTLKNNQKVSSVVLSFIPDPSIPTFFPYGYRSMSNIHSANDIEDENSVIFESELSFKEFYEKMLKSQYLSGNNYRAIDNNCVHAVLHALKIAGIDLELKDKAKYKHVICFCYFKTKMITPKDVLTAAIKLKKKVLTDNRYYEQYETKKAALLKLVKTKEQSGNYKDHIIAEQAQQLLAVTDNMIESQPLNVKTVNESLDHAIKLIENPADQQIINDYTNHTDQLMQKQTVKLQQLGITMAFLSLTCIMGSVVAFGSGIGIPAAITLAGLACVAAAMSVKYLRKSNEKKSVDTPLSASLRELHQVANLTEEDMQPKDPEPLRFAHRY